MILLYTYIFTYIHTYIHIYTRIHKYIHTHMYIQMYISINPSAQVGCNTRSILIRVYKVCIQFSFPQQDVISLCDLLFTTCRSENSWI